MFSTIGLADIGVEIYDWNKAFMPLVFPLSPNDFSVNFYEQAREALVKDVKMALERSCIAISLFGVGHSEADFKPSVVIFVKPGTVCNWRGLESELQKAIGQHRISMEYFAWYFRIYRGFINGSALFTN